MIIRQSNTIASAMEVLANDALHVSFSAFGEDLVLFSLLTKYGKRLNRQGFYVDVGAHHPWKKSNTALLSHFKRWTGINIDASKVAIEDFNKERPRDINICAAVSNEIKELEYAIFNRTAINTLDPIMREQQINADHGTYQLEKLEKVTTQRLDIILDDNMPEGQDIDFMSIDVEGFDLKVLKSNNWEKYKPYIIAVETHDLDLNSPAGHPIYDYLKHKSYSLISHTFVTSFFIRN